MDSARELAKQCEQFAIHNSTAALRRDPQYRVLHAQIDAHLAAPEHGFAMCAATQQPWYRVTAWNVERGLEFEGIVHMLTTHPVLAQSDVLLLTETDRGMARTANRNVARELAAALNMHYYFIPSYLNLAKGAGCEGEADGENAEALHGNAILSRYPLTDLDAVVLPNGKDKMRGREKRLGCQRAPVATINFPQGPVRMVCVHLDAHASRAHRALQMRTIVEQFGDTALPVLIGGDWNTSTYNSQHAVACLGDVFCRLKMGPQAVITKHYPYPERKFERHLFATLEAHGYDYRLLNALGVGTLTYDFDDPKQRQNLEEWMPAWGFPILDRITRCVNGRCSLKLDWFAGRSIQRAIDVENVPRGEGGLPTEPHVVGALQYNDRPVSDHDPIVLDIAAPPAN